MVQKSPATGSDPLDNSIRPIELIDRDVFNKALFQNQSNRLMQGFQWTSQYASKYLRVSPQNVCLSRDGRYFPGTLPFAMPRTHSVEEDDEGELPPNNSPAACAESVDGQPRPEAYELPCHFSRRPKRILITRRKMSDQIAAITTALTTWLREEWGVQVGVEEAGREDDQSVVKNIDEWSVREGPAKDTLDIDLVISLGGDGTTLWISSLFPETVPPTVGITLGNLSYLNQFTTEEMLDVLSHILSGKIFRLQLRARLFVVILDEEDEPICRAHCVNECVVDKGAAASMALVDVFVNDRFFTTVTADGLILATPSGSTAYSMSAGGAMVHPNVPGILFTPICPHSLSMRPLILPDTAIIRLRLPDGIRGSLWVSVDGHSRKEVFRKQSVLVSLSPFPFPLVCKNTCESGDAWLQALMDNLNWGMRVKRRRQEVEAAHQADDRHVLDYEIPQNLRQWYSVHRASEASRDPPPSMFDDTRNTEKSVEDL